MKKMITIFIWEVRQFDYYSNFVLRLSEHFLIEIIVNYCVKKPVSLDLFSKSFSAANKITLLSGALSIGERRPIGISTGFQLSSQGYNLTTFIKYNLFLKTIEFSSRIISFFFSKEKRSILNSFHKRFCYIPERVLCENLILFPRGLDIPPDFPGDMRSRFFDSALVISAFEKEMAVKFEKPMWVIGYPRYWSVQKCEGGVLRSMFIDPSKPLILWSPSRIDWQLTPGGNFKRWLARILGSTLLNKCNLIVRPHPHTIQLQSEEIDRLRQNYDGSIYVDTEATREMGSLYCASDIHLADYGGTIFSGVYCGCAIILLDLNEANAFAPAGRTDVALRHFFIRCGEDQDLSLKIRSVLACPNYRKLLRSNIFGDSTIEYKAFLKYLDSAVD